MQIFSLQEMWHLMTNFIHFISEGDAAFRNIWRLLIPKKEQLKRLQEWCSFQN